MKQTKIQNYIHGITYKVESTFWLTWWKLASWYRPFIWKLKGQPSLAIGDLVHYGLNSYNTGPACWRVQSWLRVAPTPKYSDDFQGAIRRILFESCQKIKGSRMQWCLKQDATHVSLVGMCGEVAAISLCRKVGAVNWPPERVAEAEASACRLGNSGELIF